MFPTNTTKLKYIKQSNVYQKYIKGKVNFFINIFPENSQNKNKLMSITSNCLSELF